MCAPRIRLWFESTVDWSAAFESLLKVEVLPIKLVDDNWSVPLAAAGLSTLLL